MCDKALECVHAGMRSIRGPTYIGRLCREMCNVLLLYEKPRIRDIIISAGTLRCGHGGKEPSSDDHHAAFAVILYAAADRGDPR